MTDKKAEQEKDSVVKKLLSSNLTWSVVALIVLIIICTISDHILTGEDTTSEQRQNSFTTMMKVALDTAVAMENKDELLGSRIQLEVSVGDIQVLTDEKWLIFILNQLINNSIQYCDREKEEQKICLKAHVEGQRVILQVYDNGIGMPSQDVPRAFEKSFTGENGRNYRRSTGMGLYIVKKMCGRLGHKIWLESTRGEYTKVTLEVYRSDFDLTKV